MKKYVCFGAYEPKSIRTRIYVAIKHSFASFDCALSWRAVCGLLRFDIRLIICAVGMF